MPAVEAFLVAPPAAPKQSIGRDTESFSHSPAPHGDFDSVMQATLAPRPQKSSAKNPMPAGKNRANGKTPPPPAHSSVTSPAVAHNGQTISDKSTGDKFTGETTDGQKKNPAGVDGTTPPDTNLSATADTAAPLPVFLSLPLFLSGAWAEPMNASVKAQKPDAAEPTGAVAGQAGEAGKPACPAAYAVPDSRGKNLPDSSPATTAASAPDKLFSPVKAGDLPPQKDGLQKLEATKAPTADESAKPAGEPVAEAGPTSPAPAVATVNRTNQAQDFAAVLTPGQQAEITGTGVATTDSPMKNLQKTNKIAGLDVKVLPVGEDGVAREKNLPPQLLVTPVRPTENFGTNLNFPPGNGSNPAATTDSTTGLSVADLPSLTDTRMRALERTNDMMTLHAMRLVESKSDVLSVIIKPAVGTELSLELRQHPDGVEARATLTRGDHQFLNQHWPELQQRLEQRGIKLAPLGGEADFMAGNNGQFQQSQASEEEAAQQASAFAEFASVGDAGGASARLAMVHDGWESWA